MKRFKQPIWTTVALAMLALQSPVLTWGQSDQMLLLKPAQPAAVQAGANTPPPVKRARLGIAMGGAPEQAAAPTQAPAAPVLAQVAPQMHLENLSDLIKVLSAQKQSIALNLCFAGTDTPDESQIMQGSAIVEGLALRADYVPLLVSHSAQLQPGKFNVLIGTVDQIAPILTPQERQNIRTGWVALKNIQGAGPGPVLVVSGKTREDMENAIISLGLVRELYPVSPSASIRDVVLPAQAPFFRREPLHYDTTYTFQQLADNGVSLSMPAGGGLSLELFLPGDFPVNGEGNMSLQLHYQLKTSGLSASAAVAVKVNGQVVAQVTGSGEQTAFFGGSGSGTDVPMSAFHAGHNVIELTPSTGGSFTGNSAAPVVNGGGLQVYSDSTLTVPKSTYVPSLPDLRVSCSTFYPFIGQPDGSNLAVLLADHQPETIDATFTLLAKLAQQCNTFLFAAQVGFSQSQMDPARHLVVVGEVKSLPAEFQNAVPMAAFAAGQLNVPLEQLNKAVSGVNLKQAHRASGGQSRLRHLP
ncbi:MAG: cellulose biosynthesis cyclic di-GMP-binding regulatory protein BcsB [Chthoniobacteraceae bacterium]